MKQYIMIILIALHLISGNLYATDSFFKQNHIDLNTHKCSFHEHKYAHEHYHSHSGSKHQHKHSHTQTNVNFLDFFVHLDNTDKFIILYSKEKYLDTAYFISNPTLNSIFRPPIA